MEAFNLILFGFIVYAVLIVIPSVWDEISSHKKSQLT